MHKKLYTVLPLVLISAAVTSCSGTRPQVNSTTTQAPKPIQHSVEDVEVPAVPVVYEKRTPAPAKPKYTKHRKIKRNNHLANSFNNKLSNAALGRLRSKVRYDGSYVKIAYPGGDVSPHTGVCTDVVIRSYRKLGIDLQEQVHRDMSAAFHEYPNPAAWGLSKPDTNIDHRRVYNLRKFFERRGAALPITHNPRNYKPGDIVTWMVGPHLPHIGVVVNKRSKADPNRFMIVHNIAHGPQMEDILFAFPVTGHYRYTPKHMGNIPSGIFTKNQQPSNLSYEQMLQAAKILGTNTNKRVAQTAFSTQPVQKSKTISNQELLNQVVRLNSLNKPVVKAKDNSLTLANLSESEIKNLLSKN